MRGYLLSLLLAVCLCDSTFNKRLLITTTGVCLDGSAGGFYISEGSGANRLKMLIYFEGGGFCSGADLSETLENCYQRSLTDLGSSRRSPAFMTLGGILSGDSSVNPQFFDWTRLLFSHCDGSGHQGFKNAAVSYKGTRLFFRGENVTMERFKALNLTHGLFTNFDEIVVSGGQVGGLAAFHWGEYIKNHARARVWSITDSGIYLDTMNIRTGRYTFRENLINLMKLSNAELDPPIPGCAYQYPNQKWRCMFAEYIYPYLQVPQFPVESLYDTWGILNILGITCIDGAGSLLNCVENDRQAMEQYKKNAVSVMNRIAAVNSNGAWGIACAGHSYLRSGYMSSSRHTVPESSNYTAYTSLTAWRLGFRDNTHIDSVSWPENLHCAGIMPTVASPQ